MLYQFKYSMKGDGITILSGENVSYQAHLHNSFEYVKVTDGKMTITVEKKSYELKRGDALLIFPNQVHEFKSNEYSANFICIFSPELVCSYAPIFEKKIPISNLFNTDKNYVCKISDASKRSSLSMQGVLYSLCGEFHEGAEYADRQMRNIALIEEIFKFVEKNYQKECTLKLLAGHTGYNYVYLSRYFKEYTGISFIEYVNNYRINEACHELIRSDKTILRIAYDCGFDSLRNFNRIFKKATNITPSEYRTQKTAKRNDP